MSLCLLIFGKKVGNWRLGKGEDGTTHTVPFSYLRNYMGIHETLRKYLHKLTRLNRAPTVYGKAPHKPVLLISIIDLFEKGMITANRIFVNTELVATFRENWDL